MSLNPDQANGGLADQTGLAVETPERADRSPWAEPWDLKFRCVRYRRRMTRRSRAKPELNIWADHTGAKVVSVLIGQ